MNVDQAHILLLRGHFVGESIVLSRRFGGSHGSRTDDVDLVRILKNVPFQMQYIVTGILQGPTKGCPGQNRLYFVLKFCIGLWAEPISYFSPGERRLALIILR